MNEMGWLWVILALLMVWAWVYWQKHTRNKHINQKGKQGEDLLRQHTERALGKRYHAFHDLLIPLYQHTTQIDHIFVSRYGVFVVETKNYTGWIYGDAQQTHWTQVLAQQKNRFYNPLKQNDTHIKALAYLLKLPVDKFHSIVVFVGDATLKTALPDNVLQGADISGFIRRSRRLLLSQQQVDAICACLASPQYRATAAKTRQHIRHVQGRHP